MQVNSGYVTDNLRSLLQSDLLSTAMKQRLSLPNSSSEGLLPLPATFVLYVQFGAGPLRFLLTFLRKRRF